MSYFTFLALFLLIPLAVLGGLTWRDRQRGITLPHEWQSYPAWIVLLAHVVVAVVYTTPWDNYLVATAVWWYNPTLVTGVTLGWVPIEEYIFFVLQTFLAGLWWLYLARRLKFDPRPLPYAQQLRRISTAVLGLIWVIAGLILVRGWAPGTYLALQLIWALPPIMLQTAFGADILWRHRRLVAATLLPLLFYLSFADALAIQSGTWTINPAQSLNIFLGNRLPLEEFIFFLLTNILVIFGMMLVLAREGQARAPAWIKNGLTRVHLTASGPVKLGSEPGA
ncbi:MAG: lycopene cyclase domain-containing protein [Anaerolineae bacterium]|nr:lycopene cyclase domain-containing protein [Anaerolineae bacterium]